MIPRSHLTFTPGERRKQRRICEYDQGKAAWRDAPSATTIRCRLCGAAHRVTIFSTPTHCECCTHPLGEEGAA
jgi:hypothetical protein